MRSEPAGLNRISGRGRLSPARILRFTWDGQSLTALQGDTLASALLANGIHLVGRSFKYHRPRGIMSCGAEEPNALVEIARDPARRQPNVRATMQEVHDGLTARSQNHFPALHFDLLAVNDLLGRFIPAGFYYKTFMWPRSFWQHLYEPAIRRAAGLGAAGEHADPDSYANRFAHCDVLVVGGGPAGLYAAQAASKAGKSVILCDENPQFGGHLPGSTQAAIDGVSALHWVEETIATLRQSGVRLLPRTTAFGYHTANMVSLVERISDHLADPPPGIPRERLWQVRAGQVVLATGAIERHMVFPDNDRPGIMLASAAQQYLHRFGVAPGRRAGIYASCDSAWAAAFDLREAGIAIVAIIDPRREVDSGLLARANDLEIPVRIGHAVTGTSGRLRVRSMTTRDLDSGAAESHEIDSLLVSGGWTPSVHLFSQSGSRLRYDAERGCFLPGDAMQDVICVGACNGATNLGEALAQAAAAFGASPPHAEDEVPMHGHWLGPVVSPAADKSFIDYQSDVTVKDVLLAVREGFQSIEHVKRYTTLGMATDQGKLSNLHGLAVAADALGRDIAGMGHTTFRAPYTPVTFGALAGHSRGRLFDVERRTPIDAWASEHGAVFENVGNWRRARYFPQANEDMAQAVNRECLTVRQIAGMFDASTLGKIEVRGPDATRFLNLLYTNSWDNLEPGRCRYGVMLREDGYIFDDGVVARLSPNCFHVTTTTGGAPRVLHHMEDYLQTEFPDLRVWLTSTTEHWAVIAVQGPKSAEIIAPFVEGVDHEQMPAMSVAEMKFAGVPARLMRVSFTGEAGFEVNVPADYGLHVWQEIWRRGAPMGMTVYGTEAMHVLRAEKGFIIVGQDTDGTVTPGDAGLTWAIGKKKKDFVGVRGLMRPDLGASGRKQLVGLATRDPALVLEEGCQIVEDPRQTAQLRSIGHVTSSYWSANCGRSIAMALIENGRARMGETVFAALPNGHAAVEVMSTAFLDAFAEKADV